MDVIGPSDVAYVISLLKNSIAVWKYDVERPGGLRPKPLYTRGERMKREFGKTAWSDDGQKFYNKALKVWKRMFSTREGSVHFGMIQAGWKEYLSWVLATRTEGEMALDQDHGSDTEGGEDEIEYDSDDDGAPMIGPGGARRGGEKK